MRILSLLTRQILKRRPDRLTADFVTLDKIRVAAPCPMVWEQMTGDNRVRHCQECKLNIYNLSDMTRAEAERLIATREGRLCVHYYRRADGTILTRDCPRGLRAVTERISRIAAAVLSAITTVGFAGAQNRPPAASQVSAQNTQDRGNLEVRVTDVTGATARGANVALLDEKNQSIQLLTDSEGQARFSNLPVGAYTVLVSLRGFKEASQRVHIATGATTRIEPSLAVGVVGVIIEVKSAAVSVEDPAPTPELTLYPLQPLHKKRSHR
jgi:hypothetical protein